jgi:serine/threonine protein phosphatase 1
MAYRWFHDILQRRAGAPGAGAEVAKNPKVPPGRRIYAIGDIHGRADLLQKLHTLIAEDAAAAPAHTQKTIVYLGDYVDRGLNSREVLDILLAPAPPGLAAVHLKGNHEEAMVRFLDDVAIGPAWFAMGGDATAYSYGVGLPKGLASEARFGHVWAEMTRRVPTAHVAFLKALPLTYSAGDYFFTHAGARPGIPLDQQSPDDLLWIREEFLAAPGGWDKVVVHGHSATHRPETLPHRIGIDTGAYATSVLTCLVLEGTERRFLAT